MNVFEKFIFYKKNHAILVGYDILVFPFHIFYNI